MILRAGVFLCWLISLAALGALLARGSGLSAESWFAQLISLYETGRDALPLGLPASLRDVAVLYLLFGVVEKAVSEWGYDYAGLTAKYQSRKIHARAGRVIGALTGIVIWPVSIALDVIAVLVWNRPAGDAAREASEQTLRRLRFGLSKEEVADVVDRYGRLTYMARPLFACALCFAYTVMMLLGFSLG